MIITIDGPAGTGKTTIAQLVAERLGFNYFDTGAMYRALTYRLQQDAIPLTDTNLLLNYLTTFHFSIRHKRYYANDEDVTGVIRSPAVTQKVSEVAAHPEVRKALVVIQRTFGKEGDAVFEGRDMGTVVFPNAELKIFLTARPEVRAHRRYLELKEKHPELTQEEVLHTILQRDHLDSTRAVSPLKEAPDARIVDTSDLTIAQVIEIILLYTKNL